MNVWEKAAVLLPPAGRQALLCWQGEPVEELRLRLAEYYAGTDGASTGVIRYSHVGAIIVGCAGVKDYSALQINGAADNVAVAAGQIPVTETADITLTEEASA